METVVIAVLIATACVIAAAVFGRTYIRSLDVAEKGLNGRGVRAGEAAEIYKADAQDDVCEARKFPSELSDAGE